MRIDIMRSSVVRYFPLFLLPSAIGGAFGFLFATATMLGEAELPKPNDVPPPPDLFLSIFVGWAIGALIGLAAFAIAMLIAKSQSMDRNVQMGHHGD